MVGSHRSKGRGIGMRSYIDDYIAPVEIVRKCNCCGNNLGLQNPGDTCEACKFILLEKRT